MVKIRHSACNFKDAVVGARRQTHAAHGQFQCAFAGLIKNAVFAYRTGGHSGVRVAALLLGNGGLFGAGSHICR